MNKEDRIKNLDDRSLILDFCLDLSRLSRFAINNDVVNFEIIWEESQVYFSEIK